MSSNIKNILSDFRKNLESIKKSESLEELRVAYLGKKGPFALALKDLRELSVEEKKKVAQDINKGKEYIEKEIEVLRQELQLKDIKALINAAPKYDATIPAQNMLGTLHPVTVMQKEIEDIFKSMGFIVEDGNEIETEFNNFEALNIPPHHPARDMTDTFFLSNGQLLKTHTSASQNRIMQKYGAPLKVIFPGRCFRNEAIDASHDNTFFQMEGMMIGENISISNLIYFMKILLREIFKEDVKVRLRPGYFPFVEPGFELDISCLICHGEGCPTCKRSGWVELLPCGMIHPSVLEMGGIDTNKYNGFAFGLGLTRLVMMKYGIGDIRVLNGGDLRVLKQFGIL